MSLNMIGEGNVSLIIYSIKEDMLNSGLTMELVGETREYMAGETVHLLVFEKYFWRAANKVSASILITTNNKKIKVSAIGSAGGQGIIFKFQFGAEKSILKPVRKFLESKGFKDVNYEKQI